MTDIKRMVASFLRKIYWLHRDMRDFEGLNDYNVGYANIAVLEGCFEILDDGLENAILKLSESVNWQNSNWNAYSSNLNLNAERNVTLASLISDSTAAVEFGYELMDAMDAAGNTAGADATEEFMDLIEDIPDVLKVLPRPPKRMPKSIDEMATGVLEVIAQELLDNNKAFELELVDISLSHALKIKGSKTSFSVSMDDAPVETFKTKQDLVNHLRSTPTYKRFLKAYVERIMDIGKQFGKVSLVYKTPGEPNIDPEDAFEYIRSAFTHFYDPKDKILRRSIMSTKRKDDLVNDDTRILFERFRHAIGLLHPNDVLYES